MGAKHAVAVSNGSIALLVSLQAFKVGPGDEVIVPNMTFISTATAAMLLGAAGLVRHQPDELLDRRRSARIPDHGTDQGHRAGSLCRANGRHGPHHGAGRASQVVRAGGRGRSAPAPYGGGKFAGTIGNAGIFSFTPTKPMTTGEGGMIVTDDDALAADCRLIRNFGDAGKFQWDLLGFNYRLNEMAAAIGICQLAKLERIIAMRRDKACRYDEAFADEEAIVIPQVRSIEDINYQLYTIRFRLELLDAGRDQLMSELADLGVATRLYYPALHRQRVFSAFGPYDDRDYPNSIEFEKSALSLPIFSGLAVDEQNYVIAALVEIVRRHRRNRA